MIDYYHITKSSEPLINYMPLLNFKEGFSKIELLCRYSDYFIGIPKMSQLKSFQTSATTKEVGDLGTIGYNREISFEACTWCDENASSHTIKVNDLLSFHKYKGHSKKEWAVSWHTHPNSQQFNQTPSGIHGSGDFYMFHHDSWAASDCLIDNQNAWRLPGRVSLIAGSQGLTVFQPIGNIYIIDDCHHHDGKYCEYGNSFGCAYKIGENLSAPLFSYWYIAYDLSKCVFMQN